VHGGRSPGAASMTRTCVAAVMLAEAQASRQRRAVAKTSPAGESRPSRPAAHMLMKDRVASQAEVGESQASGGDSYEAASMPPAQQVQVEELQRRSAASSTAHHTRAFSGSVAVERAQLGDGVAG